MGSLEGVEVEGGPGNISSSSISSTLALKSGSVDPCPEDLDAKAGRELSLGTLDEEEPGVGLGGEATDGNEAVE